MIIALDIDRTLVHSVNKYFVKQEWTEDFDTFDWDIFTIFIRPNINEFLDFLFTHFTVGIFTAGAKEYAYEIKDRLFHDRNLLFIYSEYESNACQRTLNKQKCTKYIQTKLNTDEDILLIDDSSLIKSRNKDTCYLIPKFVICFDDSKIFRPETKNDTALLDLIVYLKTNYNLYV